MTGGPTSRTQRSAASSVSRSVVPGTIGTPAFSIVCRAVTLSPIFRITSPRGPMKTTPSFSHRSAKAPRSERNP
jgi:hypothetical protein